MSGTTDLLAHRRTLGLMARQEMKQSYSRYRLGILWTLAEPFFMAILMWTVFRFLLGGDRGIGLDPFIVYLVTGMLPFQWLSQSIRKGPRILRRYGPMVASSPLPISAWPMRTVLVGAAEFTLALPVVLLLAVIFRAHLTWGVVLFPVAVLIQVILCQGCAQLGAALGFRLPDIDMITSLIVRALFWTSPILWAQRNFPEWVHPLLYLNPFHMILDFYRASIWPHEVLSTWQNYAMSGAVIAAIYISGAILLKRTVKDVRKLD